MSCPAPAPPPPPPLPEIIPPQSLSNRLSSVLPKDQRFGIHHLSTPPQRTDALFSAPPNQRPDRTYCEKHFLVLSIQAQSPLKKSQPPSEETTAALGDKPATSPKEVLVLGLEIFLYTTAHSTTLFVSKADSTGYLPLLGLPRGGGGTASPIREVCAAFIEHLVEHRRRTGVQFVISLFARSQGQYLFPGSVDHGGKHVLDDRGLIKWWCRVLDPLIRSHPPSGKEKKNARGYLLVPGLEAYETRAFIPHSSTCSSSSSSSSPWAVAHPLERISRYRRQFDQVPPRCLIPRFPDDPKCRFRDELDHEAGSAAKRHTTGSWKSVKTLDMFWEMMAYRQECSSGRMTGFIWVVLDDEGDEADHDDIDTVTAAAAAAISGSRAKLKPKPRAKKPKKLKGPIRPRQPKAKTQHRNHHLDMPTTTPYYHWPTPGRGFRIVNETTYKRIAELMLRSDFSSLDKAVLSTARWIREGGIGNGDWGCLVTGQRENGIPVREGKGDAAPGSTAAAAVVNDLGGLVKRKRDAAHEADGATTLGAGLVKKDETDVAVLSGGLVRKKPKTATGQSV
ncbi:hypothetical protein E4U41_007138 [Claviceps citrina]|nr:hypothetical protein E4U41_007138 [Claviceps citrina]